ncbi:sigma-70 family RNA polymerase sigma factor [Amycolatopsis sp. K13G38]|uniref:Sigma-70 family RNA polymerase sigma factor n=1 Tax=Amycolatopsis acididurans TaxID=2724524 RepID=A0ABX1JES6_9PSEU|nr:sigma-70 family RNA polymerase sigma factor [Amycolatopsis acididurans]NKQ58303.1 sigma-70 family RNA polymerase sigma factor [Amycolatopsis acididurans]
MNDNDWLAERFEAHRGHLRAVAYRMLGSLSEAEDAVQEAWLKLSRSDTGAVENLGGWLTTVVGRVCLDMLRARKAKREDMLDERVPDPIISEEDGLDPEHEALLADSVGLALLVVLETLNPAERLAFVLHDMFAVPFEEIAPIVDRTPAAAMQLASRARRRVRGSAPVPDPDLARQRTAVDAFLAAARDGDFDALVAVLDPDVVLRVQQPGGSRLLRGASPVANSAIMFNRAADVSASVRALVNGAAGVVAFQDGKPVSVLGFTVAGGRIVEIDIIADPDRLDRLDLVVSDPGSPG